MLSIWQHYREEMEISCKMLEKREKIYAVFCAYMCFLCFCQHRILFELIWRDYFRFISIKYGNSIFHLGKLETFSFELSRKIAIDLMRHNHQVLSRLLDMCYNCKLYFSFSFSFLIVHNSEG